MSPWWPLLGLLSWHPIFPSSHCNSFKDSAVVDFIYGCPIFEWVVVTWVDMREYQVSSSCNGHQMACPIRWKNLWLIKKMHTKFTLYISKHIFLQRTLSNSHCWKAWLSHINPLRAKFFRGNINIYLHFMSFLHTNKTQVVEVPPWVRQWPAYST